MQIAEIFYSIQGEGILIGIPSIFIRTTGCNLRCSYCDTTYAYENGTTMSLHQILSEIRSFNCKNICITGGEPLLQKEIISLLNMLLEKDYDVCLETNGSVPLPMVTNRENLMVSMDMKMPSSTMDHHNITANIKQLTIHDQLKCIIGNKKDYDFAKKLLSQHHPCCPVIFQPVWGTNIKDLASWILHDDLTVRLGLQLHKIIWGSNSRR
jgi:7-carboxy-7-deazaguanine synthase